jgi:hypothetical protein
MATVDEIITDALELTGMKDPEDALDSTWATVGLRRINSILDKWNVEKTSGYSVNQYEDVLVPTQKLYTIGSGGDFNTDRPVKITYCFVRDFSNVNHKVEILDYQTFHKLQYENINSSYPYYMWYNPKFPLGEIEFYPTPSTAYTVHFDTFFGFDKYASGSDTVSLPDGYERYITYSLAIALCSHRSKKPPMDVYRDFKDIEQSIEAVNFHTWMPETTIVAPNTNTVDGSNYIYMNRGI